MRLRLLVAATATAALTITTGTATTASVTTAQSPQTPQTPPVQQAATTCTAGARTLSQPGARVYPDTGNGGYTSKHTTVDMVYDATTNEFRTGNHVVLSDVATQCLSSLSLDFERHSADKHAGPDMRVQSVLVDGRPTTFHFARPTYPGDPRGTSDPRRRAHEASETDPVGGPHRNPLPPACTPQLPSPRIQPSSLDGRLCPANKLVITPTQPIADGARFTVTVAYTGRPGVHDDGDGTKDGWFRAPDGSLVVSEPPGTEDWMPLNDYPTAKPSYTFNDTVNRGKTAVANGVLTGTTRHAPSAVFPTGSVTWHWSEPAPVNAYLVESSVGDYQISERTGRAGVKWYDVQDATIPAKLRRKNRAVIREQQNITQFEERFNGRYPFTSDGVIVGTPRAAFEEEMETMIAFPGSRTDLDTLYHENMHQWWGDNVSEGSWSMTFFKEGLAEMAEELFTARRAQRGHGSSTVAGKRAFQASLVSTFHDIYDRKRVFWTRAPSNPTAHTLFWGSLTYVRPSAAYLALRQILGHRRFSEALQQIQQQYGGASITEPQLEQGFARWLPNNTPACQTRLATFFTQWFDTAYPKGGGPGGRPDITGPGLAGPGFYRASACTA